MCSHPLRTNCLVAVHSGSTRTRADATRTAPVEASSTDDEEGSPASSYPGHVSHSSAFSSLLAPRTFSLDARACCFVQHRRPKMYQCPRFSSPREDSRTLFASVLGCSHGRDKGCGLLPPTSRRRGGMFNEHFGCVVQVRNRASSGVSRLIAMPWHIMLGVLSCR